MQLRALVVDDEPIVRESIIDKIRQCAPGIIVSGTAGNGVKALSWLEKYHVDICITDIRMPEMDGLELIHCIKRNYPWMRNVIISSYSDFSYAQEGIKLNVSDYILKPVDRDQLQRTLTQVTQHLENQRKQETYQQLMNNLPGIQNLIENWKQIILTVQFSRYPTLVVDTLKTMEQWAGDKYYLLEPFARLWLNMVSGKVGVKYDTTGKEKIDAGYSTERLERQRLRMYYRLVAVGLLEQGMSHFIEESRSTSSSVNYKIVYDLQEYLKKNYNKRINLSEVTHLLPVSRSYLAVLFKQVTGTTVSNYLMEVRMNAAKQLLLNPELKIYEIACKVGYDNSEHFTKMFKDFYGNTPREYRNHIIMKSEVE